VQPTSDLGRHYGQLQIRPVAPLLYAPRVNYAISPPRVFLVRLPSQTPAASPQVYYLALLICHPHCNSSGPEHGIPGVVGAVVCAEAS
jgi:hypothetical protein